MKGAYKVIDLETFKPPFGPIGRDVFYRTYSHRLENGTNETFPQTIVRTVDGNLALVPSRHVEEGEREKLIGLFCTMAGLPAGRHLSASGRPGRQFLFNCHAAGWDDAEPSAHFSFLFDELMQGGGVGSNYSNRYLKTLGNISRQIDLHIICSDEHPDLHEFAHLLSDHDGSKFEHIITVQDSREGWVDTTDDLFRVSFGQDSKDEVTDESEDEITVTVDVSYIRSRGSLLKTSGGIACGPGPLVSMLTDLVKHLNGCYGRRLTSLDAMRLDHILASCVIAGGKRRSSRMSVKNWKDYDIFEFINCKREDGAHWTTNISPEIDDEFIAAYHDETHEFHDHARRVMRAVILGKRSNGEPGLWNRDAASKGERNPELMFCPNPCGEIGLQMWENCNLGHINLEAFAPQPDGTKPVVEMEEAFRLMARFLVRATFGDIPQPRQREVVDRNRRIGVGFFGYHAWLALHGIKYSESWKNEWAFEKLSNMFKVVVQASDAYAEEMGIPCPVKHTTLAPTGTTALLPGTTSSAQCLITAWFKRLVRFSDMDEKLKVLRLEGHTVYPDEDAPNTSIVEYWCEDPLVAKVRAMGFDPAEVLESQYDISLEDSLAIQARLQRDYVDNAISFTINMRPEDMPDEEEMERAFISFLPAIKGTTFFPEKSRKNSPIQPLTKEQFDAHTGPKQIMNLEFECKTGCPVK